MNFSPPLWVLPLLLLAASPVFAFLLPHPSTLPLADRRPGECRTQHLTSSSLVPQAMGERRQGDPVTSLPPSLPPSLPSHLLQAPRALQQHLAKMILSLSFLLPTACGISAGMAPPFVPVARAEEVNLLEQLEALN
ncbi:hypothetical protein NGA_0318900, partial [Nannochloropsis gaditana CCMP526]|uniref:uncharacterized protein n=1 Tax=Nannochloropsis gaditana (strain CCMP526) TaxID=1093141 RepID=UPI00029F742F